MYHTTVKLLNRGYGNGKPTHIQNTFVLRFAQRHYIEKGSAYNSSF